jgi:hypothetical protein
MPPRLADTQHLLWTLISAPEGAASALRGDEARLRDAVEAQIVGDERLSAIARVDIYAEMYFYRLLDCLAEDFRCVRSVVGETRFHNLITDYLLAHPSTHPSLRFAGRHLPTLLETHPVSTDWPFLAELARLEWALLDAFDAADRVPLAAGALERVAPSAWPALRFALAPSVRLLDLRWAVHDVWAHVERGAPAPTPRHAAITLLVWRRDLRVFHRPIDAAERLALERVRGACQWK